MSKEQRSAKEGLTITTVIIQSILFLFVFYLSSLYILGNFKPVDFFTLSVFLTFPVIGGYLYSYKMKRINGGSRELDDYQGAITGLNLVPGGVFYLYFSRRGEIINSIE